MNKYKYNLQELDITQIFIDHKIDEIVEIEKLLDAEIVRKRVELRSMVGDRYKDILAASDSIKCMKTISSKLVENIENVTKCCTQLTSVSDEVQHHSDRTIDVEKINERTFVVQMRLTISINEEMWMFLDREDFLSAAQLYLLGQHIHTGLFLSHSTLINKVPLLKYVKDSLAKLKDITLDRIVRKLESVELTSEEACSNLNSLLLLQGQNVEELMNIFAEHRKTALRTIIETSHSSVRVQLSEMVRCLITTIHLLHDCFMYSGDGLLNQQLQKILNEDSKPTISKVEFSTNLDIYLPKIVTEFRPKIKFPSGNEGHSKKWDFINKWLEDTKNSIEEGLKESLRLITIVKGLHIIREEALKIALPDNWNNICQMVGLPQNFDVWNYFFQNLITNRAKELVTIKVSNTFQELLEDVRNAIKETSKLNNELDLRSYLWKEEIRDNNLCNLKNVVSMKVLGFSDSIVKICESLDAKFSELLNDLSLYMYGTESDTGIIKVGFTKKSGDVDLIKGHLMQECIHLHSRLIEALQHMVGNEITEEAVKISIFSVRLLRALTILCPSVKKSCSSDWQKICEDSNKSITEFWKYWIDFHVIRTTLWCQENFRSLGNKSTLSMFLKWDYIEIQEQTDENIFNSQIRVPLKCSTNLEKVLNKLNLNLCSILPHTMPKSIRVQYIERNVEVVLNRYSELVTEINQNQALQQLFDVKFLTTFCVRREDEGLIRKSQEICDKLRAKIDPFDLDVFYTYLQGNVCRAAVQSQVIFGCLLPSSMQILGLENIEKLREQDKEPSILAISNPSSNSCFSLLPITAASQKHNDYNEQKEIKLPPTQLQTKDTAKKPSKSNTSIFGGLATDWFS